MPRPSQTEFPRTARNGEDILAGISTRQKEPVPDYPFLNAGPHLIMVLTDALPEFQLTL